MVIVLQIVSFLNKTIIEDNNLLVVKSIPWIDPMTAFDPFSKESFSFLLHGNGKEDFSQWSYIAFSPFASIEVDNKLQTLVNGVRSSEDPFFLIKSLS